MCSDGRLLQTSPTRIHPNLNICHLWTHILYSVRSEYAYNYKHDDGTQLQFHVLHHQLLHELMSPYRIGGRVSPRKLDAEKERLGMLLDASSKIRAPRVAMFFLYCAWQQSAPQERVEQSDIWPLLQMSPATLSKSAAAVGCDWRS